MFLTNPFAATAGTNTRNATFKIVHSDLLNKTWNVHQQYENVTIVASHSSVFKKSQQHINIQTRETTKRQLGQLFCNWL